MKKQCFLAAYGNSGTSDRPPANQEIHGCRHCRHSMPHYDMANELELDGAWRCRTSPYP
jgi:hypothetical protein